MENEEPGKLDGAPVIERVLTEEQLRTYSARVVVTYLDSDVFDLRNSQIIFRENPIPVMGLSGDRIGFASVWVDGYASHQHVVAQLSLVYDSEERLLIETKSAYIYAYLTGRVMGVDLHHAFMDFCRPVEVAAIIVDSIRLDTRAPHDRRLQAVGEPVLP